MTETSRLRWPYPRENEDPWYDTFVSFAEAVDASMYTTREDRSSILSGGGLFTFTISGLVGTLTWADSISLLSPVQGFQLSLAAQSLSLNDGELLYCNVLRAPTANKVLQVVVARQIPNTDDALLLAIRLGDRVYWRNGRIIADGEGFPLLSQSSNATGGSGPALSVTTPAANVAGAAGAAGVSIQAARGDHSHPTPVAAPVAVNALANAPGASTSLARADHAHRLEMNVQSAGVAIGSRPQLNLIGATVVDNPGQDRVDVTLPGLTAVIPLTILPDTVGAVGVGTTAARHDHAHAISTVAPGPVNAAANSEGVSASFARADHDHRLEVNTMQAGTTIGARPRLNFINATVADNVGLDRIDITIPTASVVYGFIAGTALEGNNDALYVKLAGAQTITGVKTFNAAPVLGPGIALQVDSGGPIIDVYRYSGGHEFGGGGAPMLVVGTTTSEIRTNGAVTRYVQGSTSHSFYSLTALKMTLGNGLHVGPIAVSRANGEVGAATGFVQGVTARDPSAVLDLQSTAAGFLGPRLTTVQRDAIASPATSLLIFNTTTARFEYYTGAVWAPLSSGAMSLYVAGAAGTAPGGSNPQYATLAAMQAAMVADGANAGAPRVGFFTGTFVEDVTLLDGCWLVGLAASGYAQVISGSVTTLVTSTIAGLANCVVAPPAASLGAFNNQSTDGFYLRFENVSFIGDSVGGSAGFRADGSVLANDSFIYAINCSVNGLGTNDGFVASGPIEILWNGTIRAGSGSAGSTQRAIRLDAAVDMIVTVSDEVNAESGTPTHIYGSCKLENASNLSLGVGVNVQGFSNYLVGPVFIETSLFEIENGSSVALEGGHKFQMDSNSNFLFSTGTSGFVYTRGAYALDSVFASRYNTAPGITYDGNYITHPERVQTITGTATIADDTTLALIVPASPATFTVTMSNPTNWREERRLRVKYTGGTYTQDLTLAANASLGIDYDAARDVNVLKWNDAYEFAAHDNKWIILSLKGTSGGGGSYSLPFYLAGPAGSGPGGSSPQYSTIAAAVTALGVGETTIVAMDGTYSANLTLTNSVRIVSWARHNGTASTGGNVVITGNVVCNPSASGKNMAIQGVRIAPAAGQGVNVTGANWCHLDLSGTDVFGVDEGVYVDSTHASTSVYAERAWIRSSTKSAFKATGAAHIHQIHQSYVETTSGIKAVEVDTGASVAMAGARNIAGVLWADGGAIYCTSGGSQNSGADSPFKLLNAGLISVIDHTVISSNPTAIISQGAGGGTFLHSDLRVIGSTPRVSDAAGSVLLPYANIPGVVVQVMTASAAVQETADLVYMYALTAITATLPTPVRRIPKKVTLRSLGAVNHVVATAFGSIDLAATRRLAVYAAMTVIPDDGGYPSAMWRILSSHDPSVLGYVPLLSALFTTDTTLPASTSETAGGNTWHPDEHDYSGYRTIKFRAVLGNDDGVSPVQVALFSVFDMAYVENLNGFDDYLETTLQSGTAAAMAPLVSQDLRTGHANFTAGVDGRLYEVHVRSTVAGQKAICHKAELVIGLP